MPEDGMVSPHSASNKALKLLGHRAPKGVQSLKGADEAFSTELHKHLLAVHLLQPSSLSGTIMEYSQNVGAACDEKDLADYNRVRFLVAVFQPQLLCPTFRVPCRDCNREAECHPWKRGLKTRCLKRHLLQVMPSPGPSECSSCKCQTELPLYACVECRWHLCPSCRTLGNACTKFIPKPVNKLAVCVCGHLEAAHPVEQDTDFVCSCDSVTGNFQCVLSTIKTYIGYGLREVVWALCERVKMGTVEVEKEIQRWLLHLLYILASAASNPGYSGCAGFRNLNITIQPAESDSDLFVISNSSPYENASVTMNKNRNEVLSFCNALSTSLKDEVSFPHLDVGATVEVQNTIVANFLAIIVDREYYPIICQVDKARSLFVGFFAIESRLPTLSTFTNCISLFVGVHRANKTVSSAALQALVELMVGDRVKVQMVMDVVDQVPEAPRSFTIPRIREGWLVPHVFDCLSAASNISAFDVLVPIQQYLLRIPSSAASASALQQQQQQPTNNSLMKNKPNLGDVSGFVIDKLSVLGRGVLCSSALLQYMVHMCQTLLINPRKNELVAADAEAWLCVLDFVTSGLKKEELPALTNTHRSALYQLIHHHLPCNSVSKELVSHSVLIESAFPDCEQEESDWNRLRMLASCLHPLTRSYASSSPSRVWYQCTCSSDENACLLFAAKTLISNGAFNVLLTLCPQLENNTAQLWLLQGVWCLICAVSNPNFPLCTGKSFTKLFVQSCHNSSGDTADSSSKKTTQSSMYFSAPLPPDAVRMQDLTFFIGIEAKANVRTLQKSYNEMRFFCETMIDLLPTFHWPLVPRHTKEPLSNTHPEIEYTRLFFIQVLEMFNHPFVYKTLCGVHAARELFFRFFQIDAELVSFSRAVFGQCVNEVLSRSRSEKNVPKNVMDLLISFLSGNPPKPPSEVIQAFPAECAGFSMSTVMLREIWVLAHVFDAVSVSPPALAMEVLRELDIRLVAQPKTCLRIAKRPHFQSWFLPILFDQAEPQTEVVQTSENGELEGGQFAARLQLSIHLLASVHASLIIRYDGSSDEQKKFPHPADTLLRGITLICNGASKAKKMVPWSRNLLLVRNFAGCVLNKLASCTNQFCTSLHHPAWNHIFDVLNIYRNLVCCEMSSNLGKGQLDGLMKWLLNAGVGELSGFEQQILPESVVHTMCEFLKQLHLFDLEMNIIGNPEDLARARTLQGCGLGFMAFFKECLTVLRAVGSKAQAERDRVIRHFYSTHRFSRAFVKEDLERLKAIEDNDARRRRTMVTKSIIEDSGKCMDSSEAQEALRQRKRDFQLLDAGVTVFVLSSPLDTCHLYLKRKANETEAVKKNSMKDTEAGKRSPFSTFRSALVKPKETDGNLIVLEINQKKRTLSLFDEVKLVLGSSAKAVLGDLEHTRDRCITLKWGRKNEVELGCSSQDDFMCWVRILAHMAWENNFSESMGGPVDTEMFLANRPSLTNALSSPSTSSSPPPPSPPSSAASSFPKLDRSATVPLKKSSSTNSLPTSSFVSEEKRPSLHVSTLSSPPSPKFSSKESSDSPSMDGDRLRARSSGSASLLSPSKPETKPPRLSPRTSKSSLSSPPPPPPAITWAMITGK